jgi:hypothetical protein
VPCAFVGKLRKNPIGFIEEDVAHLNRIFCLNVMLTAGL